MRAVGYTRLSKDTERNGAGLKAQERAIRSACRRRGWALAELYSDSGRSGGSLDRPELGRALDSLAEGDVLVVAKLDRLTRSTLDFGDLLRRSEREGWRIVVLDPDLDMTTPWGEAMANMLMTFAQLERRLIRGRIREALAEKRDEGVRLGRPPKRVAPKVRERIDQLRAEGRSFRAVADALNEAAIPSPGGGRWHPTTVKRAVAS